ncbi:unnamed protein product [Camellia sinensis]
MGIQKDTVKFNVGGKIFETTATTLANAGRNSLFGTMFNENWNLQTHNFDEYFIDRNPDCFAVLLDLLRTGELCIPSNIPEKLLHREALFYGLLDHVRTAKWGQFDGNRLRFLQSVMGQAPGDGTAIRAGPDGGCCVLHGSRAGLALRQTVVVTACERLGRGGGGMGLFSAGTGELRHRFQVTHDDQIDFYYEPIGWSLGEADRLQFLHGTNCLLVATLFPRKDNCYISLLDFRDKSMVWSWSDIGAPATDERRVRDAIAMEETGSICVVNEYEDLGFMDLRSSGGSVKWCSRSRLMKGKMPEEPCYPKLALHVGHLFSSMNDSISVFCGSDWVLTSRLRQSYGGSICDFSVGGDRLFALHSEENVFDIWETPPAPIT